jgi:peptide/nickel transport system permease protein
VSGAISPELPTGNTKRALLRDRRARVGLAIILTLAASAIVGRWLLPWSPDHIDLAARYLPPLSPHHILGTDDLGRDVLARLFAGGRVSLFVGVSAMVVTICIGFLVGGFGGYIGGWVEALLMRFTDMMLCFPSMLLLLFLAILVPPSLVSLALVIGLTSWMEVARLSHAQVSALKHSDFLEAARLAGASSHRIVTRQILPNAMGPLLVAAVLNTAHAILLESYIGFLGYGLQPPAASWGNMLTHAQSDFAVDPWLAVFPGLAAALAVTSLNLLGDSLRDAIGGRREQ